MALHSVVAPTVVSPDVLFARRRFAQPESRFVRSMKLFRPDKESTLIFMFVGAFFRTKNIHTPFSPVYLH